MVQHLPTMGKWTVTLHVRGLMCPPHYIWGLAVPPWGCDWILCISTHPRASPYCLFFGVLWTGDERSAPSFCKLKVRVFAVGFSGPWEYTSESVTNISPGIKLAGHFWSSSDPRLEPWYSPFPTLRSHWESMTSSSSGITHLRGSFKNNGWLCHVFKLCCALHWLCAN